MAQVIIFRHGERHDYEERNAGRNFTATADRPFDPPLTLNGCKQGSLCGLRILQLQESLSIPAVTKIYTSPLIRCGQTASHAAQSLNLESITIENGLVESINEDWYRSWAVAGADSTWGGPAHCRTGIHPVDKSDLSPKAFVPAQELYNTPTSMEADSNVVTKICSSHQPFWSGFDYNWDNLETPLSQTQRLKDTVLYLSSLHSSNETIALCSHGGPCYHIYEALTGEHYSKEGPCGYTAISVFSPPKHGDGEIWKVSKTKQTKTKQNSMRLLFSCTTLITPLTLC